MRRIYFFQTILVFLDNYQVIQFKNISNKMKFNGTHADWYEISYRLVETRANCANTLSCHGVRFLRNFHLNLFHLSILLAHIRVLVCCVGRKQAITFEFIVRELLYSIVILIYSGPLINLPPRKCQLLCKVNLERKSNYHVSATGWICHLTLGELWSNLFSRI